MITVNSLSGGKTSSYMAVHYPADYNIFALVRIEDKKCTPKDEGIVKYVSDKIEMEFIATAESDKTLYVMRDLEQLLGKEIIWATGDTFEQVCRKKKALPNLMMRFCTTEMKMKPIFQYCFYEFGIAKMNIGFRHDEIERQNSQNTKFKAIVGKHKSGKNKWAEIEWRECSFPLIQNRITVWHVLQWAVTTGLIFPPDSNCVGCFWKSIEQLRKNWEDEPLKMQWFMNMEIEFKRRWKKQASYSNIKKLGLQQDFNFGGGAGCNGGYCTD